MTALSPLRAIFNPLALQRSWVSWQHRTEKSVVAGVIRADRPTADPEQRIRPRTAVLAYREIDGRTVTAVFERDRFERPASAVLDAFEHFYALAAQSINRPTLYIDHSVMRAEVRDCAASFPEVALMESPLGCLTPLFHAAGRALPTPPRSTSLQSASACGGRGLVIQVATDASKRLGRAGVGISAVDGAGAVCVGYLPDVDDVNLGECLAIELAVRQHTGSLEIVTDSQCVATFLQGCRSDLPRWVARDYVGRVRMLQEKLRSTGSTVQWVRGHTGHPLNEAAHRAAIAVRRNNEFDVSPAVATEMYRRIGVDAVQMAAV